MNTESSYVGGAHGNYYENAEVFDTQKGKVLELKDVVKDYDKVYQYVLKYLKENYDEERFFEDYEQWIEEMFYEPDGAMASPIEWYLTLEGMEFVFNPYVNICKASVGIANIVNQSGLSNILMLYPRKLNCTS